MIKECKHCKKEFEAKRNTTIYCSKNCNAAYWWSNNKEKVKIKKRKYHKKYYQKYNSLPENKIKNRENSWKNNGIKNMTVERYNKLYKEQKGCCKICGRNEKEFKMNLNVDHNHETGEVRGLLCVNCNRGLGRFKDNKEILLKAANYLDMSFLEISIKGNCIGVGSTI